MRVLYSFFFDFIAWFFSGILLSVNGFELRLMINAPPLFTASLTPPICFFLVFLCFIRNFIAIKNIAIIMSIDGATRFKVGADWPFSVPKFGDDARPNHNAIKKIRVKKLSSTINDKYRLRSFPPICSFRPERISTGAPMMANRQFRYRPT